MCNCLDLKYASRIHTHPYAKQKDINEAIQVAVDQMTAMHDADIVNLEAVIANLEAVIANLQAYLDQQVGVIQDDISDIELPTGSIQMWAGSSDPPGGKWMVCDGRTLDGNDYPDLYAVIGQTFSGYPAPGTTFPLPDLRGRFPLGVGGAVALGNEGGEEEHALTVDEMPAHNHDTSPGYIVCRNPEGGTGNIVTGPYFSIGEITHTGGDAPHNNMPPYLAINFIIKVL